MDKIICLGKNYAAHAKELKEELPEKPVLFLKPPSVLIEPKHQSTLKLPWERGSIHHELEVVFKLYKKNIIAIGIGLDLTLRDLQKELKDKGHPWEKAKVFKNSAILAPLKTQKDFPNWKEETFSLFINNECKQSAKITDAILEVNETIHYIDQFFPLSDGDLVFTGTPPGVGPLKPGDHIKMQWGPIHHEFTLQ
jgi:2-keto-4-pentenoate hydratase/2-oxohepta-3-ene-1,7-dioic acid hydratase in catechol pathway